MSDIDFERAANLLSVAEACTLHGGKLAALGNAATAELIAMSEAIRKEAIAAQKAADDEAATAAAAAAKESTDDEEAETPPSAPSNGPSVYRRT